MLQSLVESYRQNGKQEVDKLQTDVDGEPAVVLNGQSGGIQEPLLEVSLEEMVRAVARKRRAIKEAAAVQSKAAALVKELKDDLEDMLEEFDARDQRSEQMGLLA